MFMQAGFAIVETGLTRVKNANHTMMMNFMVYGVGMLAYWLIGFAIQEGGLGAVANLGSSPVLNHEFAVNIFGKPFGLWGAGGFFLMHSGSYDIFVMVMFLFQMVFMDTALTIVTGTAAERWKYAALWCLRLSWEHSRIRFSPTGLGAAAGLLTSARISAWDMATPTLRDRASYIPWAESPPWRWECLSDLESASSRGKESLLQCQVTIFWWCFSVASFLLSAGLDSTGLNAGGLGQW